MASEVDDGCWQDLGAGGVGYDLGTGRDSVGADVGSQTEGVSSVLGLIGVGVIYVGCL